MKGFVFDLDNTLFDRYATITEIITKNYDAIKKYINPSYDLPRALDHAIHTERLFVQEFAWRGVYDHLVEEHFFNADCTPTWEQFREFVMKNFYLTAVPFPFAKPLLEKIRQKGYVVALLTNGSISMQRAKMQLVGLEDSFDLVVCASEEEGDSDILIQKPDPAPFLFTAEKLGIAPEELYYVGDNPINDIQGAQAAGYVPVWIRAYSPWSRPNDQMPALCYDDVRGLEELL